MIWHVGNSLVWRQQNVCQVYLFGLSWKMPSSIHLLGVQFPPNHAVTVDIAIGKPPGIESVTIVLHDLWYCCDWKAWPARVQSFALCQQATKEITRQDHFIIIHTTWCYSSHISCVWWIRHSTPCQLRGCNFTMTSHFSGSCIVQWLSADSLHISKTICNL